MEDTGRRFWAMGPAVGMRMDRAMRLSRIRRINGPVTSSASLPNDSRCNCQNSFWYTWYLKFAIPDLELSSRGLGIKRFLLTTRSCRARAESRNKTARRNSKQSKTLRLKVRPRPRAVSQKQRQRQRHVPRPGGRREQIEQRTVGDEKEALELGIRKEGVLMERTGRHPQRRRVMEGVT